MAQDTTGDLLNRLKGIREQITALVESMQKDLSAFIEKYKSEMSANNNGDIEVVQTHLSLMKDKTNALISDASVNDCKNSEELQQHLAKSRHDFHNNINVIMGYLELLLTDLQKHHANDCVSELSGMIAVMHKILKAADEIKTNEPDVAHDVEKYMMTEVEKDDLEFEEFDAFKKKLSVLVVDDVEENRRILQRYLKELGFDNITMAQDGLETLKLLKKRKVDLILLDIDMPNVTGKEVLAFINEDLVRGRTMVIMISGYDSIEDTVECIKLGAEDLITKPFNIDLLRVRINACVERKYYKYKENIYHMKYELVKKNLMRGYYVLNILYLLWKL